MQTAEEIATEAVPDKVHEKYPRVRPMIAKLIDKGIMAEREACAKLAEVHGFIDAGIVAKKIRERGDNVARNQCF